MSNRMEWIDYEDRVRPPSEAEVTIVVKPERLAPTTELRGRLTGPTCLGASTIEVAHPLQVAAGGGAGTLSARAVVPEASLWEPARPFLYRAFVELREDGRRCDRRTFALGFRSASVGPRGLIWNGFPLSLTATRVVPASPAEVAGLREQGVNLLIASVAEAEAWPRATELGLLMLGRVPLTKWGVERAAALNREACCLGWLLEPGRVDEELLAELRELDQLVGIDVREWGSAALPAGLDFVVGPDGVTSPAGGPPRLAITVPDTPR